MQGTLHVYHPTRSLLLFEHLNLSSSSSTTSTTTAKEPPHTLLFVGGMYDNFLTPAYTMDLVRLVSPSHHWRLCHVQLSSAGRSFGVSGLAKDVSELAIAIKFIREQLHRGHGHEHEGKIVLMGHSTGCQDALSYLYLPVPSSPLASRPKVDGIILQAPVSDRDAATPVELHPSFSSLSSSSALSKASEGEGETEGGSDPGNVAAWKTILSLAQSITSPKEQTTTILPLHLTTPFFGPAPLSVARFLSLASPTSPATPREDDLFSFDATESWLASTWGRAMGDPDQDPDPALGGGAGVGVGVLNPYPLPSNAADRGGANSQSASDGTQSRSTATATAKAKRQILLLPSLADEHVPAWIDKAALLRKWTVAVEKAGGKVHERSALVEGGGHDLGGEGVTERWGRLVEMRGRVAGYLDGVRGIAGEEREENLWRVWEEDRAALEVEREREKEKEKKKDRERRGGGNAAEEKLLQYAEQGKENALEGRSRGGSASKI